MPILDPAFFDIQGRRFIIWAVKSNVRIYVCKKVRDNNIQTIMMYSKRGKYRKSDTSLSALTLMKII